MIQIGVAVEEHTCQFAGLTGQVDFVEYGCRVSRGVPEWVRLLVSRLGVDMVLHPVDVNLCRGVEDGEWLASMRALVVGTRSCAVVSDVLHWSWGPQRNVWPRTPRLQGVEANCRESASQIAAACGVPFRVENPPLDWQPEPSNVWDFLAAASDAHEVEICLDLSHLLQGMINLDWDMTLPRGSFPWQRVTEIHLAGFLDVSYRGRRFRLDDHSCPLGNEQLFLLQQILDRRGGAEDLQVCLEMEGHEASALLGVIDAIRVLVQRGGQ